MQGKLDHILQSKGPRSVALVYVPDKHEESATEILLQDLESNGWSAVRMPQTGDIACLQRCVPDGRHQVMPLLDIIEPSEDRLSAQREIVLFRRVPIATPGLWHLSTGDWDLTLEEMDQVQSSYDPQWLTGTFDTDHDGIYFGGPSYGLISRAYIEGKVLYCDLVGVDQWLARGIDEGRWPHRSFEVGSFIDQGKPLYLVGLTALGKRLPAMQGLGPWPKSERLSVDDLPAGELIEYVNNTGAKAAAFRAASHHFITKQT